MHHPQRDPEASQISHQMNVAAVRPGARPPAKRLTSSGWGRLRAPQIDPLEAYGLPSKGETRLNDHKTQESYHRKIVDRYMRFCAASGSGDALEAAFRSVTVSSPPHLRASGSGSSDGSGSGGGTLPRTGPISTSTSTTPSASTAPPRTLPLSDSLHAPPPQPEPMPTPPASLALSSPAQSAELALLLSAMRKLRESLTATARVDPFAQRAYVFILRATLLMRQWESYLPCLLHLLHVIHPVTPLGGSELREIVGWWVLDVACRQGRLGEAIQVRARWMGMGAGKRTTDAADERAGSASSSSSSSPPSSSSGPRSAAAGPAQHARRQRRRRHADDHWRNGLAGSSEATTGRDRDVDAIVRALVRDDFVAWRKIKGRVDGYVRSLMEGAEEAVRLNLLKVVGRAYLRVERGWLEEWSARTWDQLVEEGVGWELEGDGCVVVRRIRGKVA